MHIENIISKIFYLKLFKFALEKRCHHERYGHCQQKKAAGLSFKHFLASDHFHVKMTIPEKKNCF